MIIGTGIDIIEIGRIQKAVERWGESFLMHVFTSVEIKHGHKYSSPFQYYAGRFAAKEAIFKALGDPKLTWHDLTITNDAEGKPVCTHKDKHFKHRILISISHGKDHAVASAIVEAQPQLS